LSAASVVGFGTVYGGIICGGLGRSPPGRPEAGAIVTGDGLNSNGFRSRTNVFIWRDLEAVTLLERASGLWLISGIGFVMVARFTLEPLATERDYFREYQTGIVRPSGQKIRRYNSR